MLVLTLQDVDPCGVQTPGSTQIKLGIRHKDRCYYYERFLAMGQKDAMTQFRQRIDRPLDPQEICILLQVAEGYRLCVNLPGIVGLSYEEAAQLICEHMSVSDTLKVGDNRWGMRVYKKSFVGSDAVTWLADYLQLSRQDAVQFGQLCLEQGLFRHVLNEQSFADDYFFYRFAKDGSSDQRAIS